MPGFGAAPSRRNFVPASVSRDDLMTFVDLVVRNMGVVSAMPPACWTALTIGLLVGRGCRSTPVCIGWIRPRDDWGACWMVC